ncbi:hypothetical protein OS493_021033 [Desmophyllum pertusum]|uniref:Uncharacterized protein n=1 Tax=Desmophyllum pertusum TaxID=174260 RepID=A0A9X0A198_9CNID|nr:hypothetical protein OS493_021033 [Desmophyllum pertusum]
MSHTATSAPETAQSGCKSCGPSPFVGPMCSVCWDILYKVIKFLPVVRDRNALKPDFVSATDWQVWREFFSRNRNRLFWKGISSKPRYRVSQQSEEATIFIWNTPLTLSLFQSNLWRWFPERKRWTFFVAFIALLMGAVRWLV